MEDQGIPSFYIHNFDSPQLYTMPVGNGISCWQLESLSGDAASVLGYHGYTGFFTDFKIFWLHDGEALAKFNGYATPGSPVLATYRLRIIATSGVMGVERIRT